MGKIPCCCFTELSLNTHRKRTEGPTRLNMENPQNSNAAEKSENLTGTTNNSSASRSDNIIKNHDFSQGLHFWHPNCCESFVVSPEANSTELDGYYAVVTNRRECWQGLEQDITGSVSLGLTYSVSARVGVSGPLQGPTDVLATLKLEYPDSATSYLFLGKTSVSKERWEILEGKFALSNMPKRVVFYIEGPSPGVELLIKSVVISCSSNPGRCEGPSTGSISAGDENIILNPTFDDGLNNWVGRGCKIMVHDAMADGKIVPMSGKYFACATERMQTWNGIQQEITGRVQRKLAYEVSAVVRIFGNNVSNSDLRITLWTQTSDSREQYIGVA